MSDEVKKDELDEGLMNTTDFRIGYDKTDDPDVMVFNVPLKRCAEDLEYGSALIRGKLDEAKQIALKLITAKRERRKMLTGLAKPGRSPLGVA